MKLVWLMLGVAVSAIALRSVLVALVMALARRDASDEFIELLAIAGIAMVGAFCALWRILSSPAKRRWRIGAASVIALVLCGIGAAFLINRIQEQHWKTPLQREADAVRVVKPFDPDAYLAKAPMPDWEAMGSIPGAEAEVKAPAKYDQFGGVLIEDSPAPNKSSRYDVLLDFVPSSPVPIDSEVSPPNSADGKFVVGQVYVHPAGTKWLYIGGALDQRTSWRVTNSKGLPVLPRTPDNIVPQRGYWWDALNVMWSFTGELDADGNPLLKRGR